jgi:hypothetical protein
LKDKYIYIILYLYGIIVYYFLIYLFKIKTKKRAYGDEGKGWVAGAGGGQEGEHSLAATAPLVADTQKW